MGIYHNCCDSDPQREITGSKRGLKMRFTALFLCLAVLLGSFHVVAWAASDTPLLRDAVTLESVGLYYDNGSGEPGAEVKDNDLIEKDKNLVLQYKYIMNSEQCSSITAGTKYYLDISPHLVPKLSNADLNFKNEDNTLTKFGSLKASDGKAWIEFEAKSGGTGTVLSDYGELTDAYVYLGCQRSPGVPDGVQHIEGKSNRYELQLEGGKKIEFGYAEREPVVKKASINKNGALNEKTITWTITYTPHQNPAESSGITTDTPFEILDTIDMSKHSLDTDSVKINGIAVSIGARDKSASHYASSEVSEDGKSAVLYFGGTDFNAVESTAEHPADPIVVTYNTVINDELLLPGGNNGGNVTNSAELFADKGSGFVRDDANANSTVTIPQPEWLKKERGTTVREEGNGSVTDWTVTFKPNGFNFASENNLVLHDEISEGSALEGNVSVTIGGTDASSTVTTTSNSSGFTVSDIVTNNETVILKYKTRTSEDMYEQGKDLGTNTAWFTFDYNGKEGGYITPKPSIGIGSGNDDFPGTALIVKKNSGYNAANRSITWTVTINPHKADLKNGTFTDDLKIGTACGKDGHNYGLKLVNGVSDINVTLSGASSDSSLVTTFYSDQVITISVGNVGKTTVTLEYTTKICDPCIFANNTNTSFVNTVSTDDMCIGSNLPVSRSASSWVNVNIQILKKNPPVYDYETGRMKWTVDINAAELPLTNVELTDVLCDGLTYVDGSFSASPEIIGANASASGQTLTIDLGTFSAHTTVSFETAVDPEKLGFNNGEDVTVENSISMNGQMDGENFAGVSSNTSQSFSDHGLIKSGKPDGGKELIEYEVLINPYHLKLSADPTIIDTPDPRLQIDTETLKFYKVTLSGTAAGKYNDHPTVSDKTETDSKPTVKNFDPATNSYTIQLPIEKDSTDAYLLTYTADIISFNGNSSYSNKIQYSNGMQFGGGGTDSANVAGGGGGGGGGVASRKATISIVKIDSVTGEKLPNVAFTLYNWSSETNQRGIVFAQGKTDGSGNLSFKVTPGAQYELVETEGVAGYDGKILWNDSLAAQGVEKTENGLLIKAGDKGTTLTLELQNKAYSADIVFYLFNGYDIPITGEEVSIFTSDPGIGDPEPIKSVTVDDNGKVTFPEMPRGKRYYIKRPDGGIMTIDIPLQTDKKPLINLPDGTTAEIDENYRETSDIPEKQWELTVNTLSDDGTPLSDVEVGLYTDEECLEQLKVATSDSDGKVTFPGLMKSRNYWVKEISVPEEYELNTSIYQVSDANTELPVENTPVPVTSDDPDSDSDISDTDNSGVSDSSSDISDTDNSSVSDSDSDTSDTHDVDASDSNDPDNRDESKDNSDNPQTGDRDRLYIMAVFLLGIVSAAMVSIRIRKRIERERNKK